MAESANNKYRRKWLVLMIAPFVSLFIVALAQLIVNFMLDYSAADIYNDEATASDVVRLVINIFSWLVGIVSVVLIFFFPVWLVMYLKSKDGKRSKLVAILLACFLGFWTWLYTYEKDATKFWVNLALSLATFGYWTVVGWVWSIIDTVTKPDDFYENYAKHVAGKSKS